MSRTDGITTAERSAALGRFFRGIIHENANTLNAILMNAQLGKLSADEAPEALNTITNQARSGGDFLRRLSSFAGGTDLSPREKGTLAESLRLMHRLLGSTVRREKVALKVDDDEDCEIPLDIVGMAVTLALFVDGLCSVHAEEICITSGKTDEDCTIVLEAHGIEMDQNRPCIELALRFASQLAIDHGGEFDAAATQWHLKLPR